MANVPKINNAHGPDTRNIINRAIDSINVQGKSIQDLVAKGQLTPTQYANLIQTVNGLISKGEVTLDDLDSEVLKAFGEVSPEFNLLSIPRDGSVTPDKTTFLKKTTNLFNGIYYPYVLQTITGGGMRIYETFSGEKGGLAIISVLPNTTYTIKSYDLEKTDAFRIGLSNKPLEFSPSKIMNLDTAIVQGDFTVSDRTYTFTTSGDSKFAFVYVSKTGAEPKIQFELGSNADEYKTPYVLADEFGGDRSIMPETIEEYHLKDNIVTPEKTTLFEKSKNIFDGNYYNWFIYNFGTENLTAYIRRNYGGKDNTAMVKVDPGKTYTIKIHDIENSNEFTIVTAPTEPVFNSTGIFDAGRPHQLQGKFTHPEREYTLKIPNGDRYLYIMTGTDIEPPKMLQVEEGSEPTDYIGSLMLKKEYYNFNENTTTDKKVKTLAFQDMYSVPALEGINSPNSTHKIHDQNSSTMYALYDALKNKFPDYITKKIAGTESTGKTIYKYIFKPTTPAIERIDKETDLLEFLIVSGVHGSEKAAWWCTYEMMKQICESWKTSSALSKLRWDVEFTVIPILNVYGVDNPSDPKTFNGKINSNGIDINRNLPTGWSVSAPGTIGYGGPEPLSEPETQIIYDLIENNNYDFYADFHNFSSQSDPNIFLWNILHDEFGIDMSQKYISQITQKWKVQDEVFPQNDTDFFGYTSTGSGGSTPPYVKDKELLGGIFEITHTMHPKGTTSQYSSEVITLGTEAQLNWLYMAYLNLTN